MKSLLLFLLPFSVLAQVTPRAGEQDHYKNFEELARANTEGKDFSIQERDTVSSHLVMAFHGGTIEPGTTELGMDVARDDMDFYTFVGVKNTELHEPSFTASDLHLTSARFDEPKLLALAKKASLCLALHGFGGEEADFCVGGANQSKRKELVEKLTKAFPALRSCDLCCPPFNGTSLKNPVNRCEQKGVQVEMGPQVRRRLLKDEAFRRDVARVMRELFPSE